MKNQIVLAIACASLLCGCASSKKEAIKPTFERPWIGGHFKTAYTPKSARTNSSVFGKHGALISNLRTNTPLEKAGFRETDLILAVNGQKVRTEKQIHKRVERSGAAPATFTIYRDGEILEKSLTPGRERYQNWRIIAFKLGLSSHLDFKLWPSPNFSLVALGFEEKPNRLDLQDAMPRFQLAERAREKRPDAREEWAGLQSEEGWKTWLGPFALEKRRVIMSQE
jgi:membrane-associated protease RseP (regulator of RpoE activity)